jgi:hypothetical protein
MELLLSESGQDCLVLPVANASAPDERPGRRPGDLPERARAPMCVEPLDNLKSPKVPRGRVQTSGVAHEIIIANRNNEQGTTFILPLN